MTDDVSFRPAANRAVDLATAQLGARRGLPPDLLQDISRRLTFLCVLVLVVALADAVIAELTGTAANQAFGYLDTGLIGGTTLLVLYLSRRGGQPPQRLLDIGLAYEVVVGVILAQSTVALIGLRPAHTWSVVAVWVLIFPVVVPHTLSRTAFASILTAASEPIFVLGYAAAGSLPRPTVVEFVSSMWPNALAVFLALAVSNSIYQLRQQLAKARSMGSYQLVERLGKGGMGEVWKGEHRLLARPAAVKLIQPEILGDVSARATLLQRFEREAQVTAALQSPHTVHLYDFGVANDGTLYYVMELLEGIDLWTLVRRHGPQPPGRVIRLLGQACESIYEAHLRGLVHRDIKPANIMACRYSTNLDFVKVLDFGLVKRGPAAEDAQLTTEGAVSGTPAFMPPEQAAGAEQVDGRADIYALGCVAYWLLTGELVFPRSSPMAMVIAHATEEPPNLSSRTQQDIPEKLEDVIMACLAKDPAQRPQTAHALSTMLKSFEHDLPWTAEMALAWWEEHSYLPDVVESA